MNTIPAWKCLSVAEFINQCNWKNNRSPARIRSAVEQRKALTDWKSLTTKSFFALSNWSGQAFVPSDLTLAAPAKTAFDLTFASNQFWQCFNWSGDKPALAPQKAEQILIQTEEAIAAVEEFTLNDLSQLF
ncbi:MAG: hypothetical protein AAFQ14_13840 [Cyanobacteria bacterium J06621_12]